ncbi:dimethylamine monooxygenase subunit DmmA family protein [soil metagenome]
MSDQGIKSRPVYAPIARDASGRAHLLVADDAALSDTAFADGTMPEDFVERWTIAGNSTAIPSPHGETVHAFRSASHLMISLKRRLAEEHMGFRLYAIGTEPFLWDVAGAAQAAGMGRAEYRLFATGSAARRLFCVHCRTITEHVTGNLVACSGCGAQLFVRDHFSRRMNAFMGFQIDAEAPGESVPYEELYR